MSSPSRETATELTAAKCPLNDWSRAPEAESQIFTVRSALPDTTRLEDMVRVFTALECKFNLRRNCPVCASQRLTDQSALAEASHWPLGEYATDLTLLPCEVRF